MGLCPTRAITGRSNYCSVTEPFDIVGQKLLNNTVIVVVLRKKTIGSINLIHTEKTPDISGFPRNDDCGTTAEMPY